MFSFRRQSKHKHDVSTQILNSNQLQIEFFAKTSAYNQNRSLLKYFCFGISRCFMFSFPDFCFPFLCAKRKTMYAFEKSIGGSKLSAHIGASIFDNGSKCGSIEIAWSVIRHGSACGAFCKTFSKRQILSKRIGSNDVEQHYGALWWLDKCVPTNGRWHSNTVRSMGLDHSQRTSTQCRCQIRLYVEYVLNWQIFDNRLRINYCSLVFNIQI